MRIKGGPKHKNRRRAILRLAKGFKGKRRSCFRIARERVMHALRNAYIGRKLKKRDYRALWNTRINAATRLRGMQYSRFMNGLYKANIKLNRKMLSELAVRDPKAFDQLVAVAKSKLS